MSPGRAEGAHTRGGHAMSAPSRSTLRPRSPHTSASCRVSFRHADRPSTVLAMGRRWPLIGRIDELRFIAAAARSGDGPRRRRDRRRRRSGQDPVGPGSRLGTRVQRSTGAMDHRNRPRPVHSHGCPDGAGRQLAVRRGRPYQCAGDRRGGRRPPPRPRHCIDGSPTRAAGRGDRRRHRAQRRAGTGRHYRIVEGRLA